MKINFLPKQAIIASGCVVMLLVIVGFVIFGTVKTKGLQTSMKPIESTFYSDQLTKREKEIYHEIIDQLNNYDVQLIKLNNYILESSLDRVELAISASNYGTYDYWGTLPLDYNMQYTRNVWKDRIYGLAPMYIHNYSIIVEESFRRAVSEERINEALEHNWIEGYEALEKEIEQRTQNIIDLLPENSTQEQAINFFSDWIKSNITFIDALDTSNDNNDFEYLTDEAVIDLAIASNLSCVLINKGTHKGVNLLLCELLNRVGIESYPIFGRSGAFTKHSVTAVKIGEKTKYVNLLGDKPNNESYIISKFKMTRIMEPSHLFNYDI